jgi:hypothetical protein
VVGHGLLRRYREDRSGGRTPRAQHNFYIKTNSQLRGATWQPLTGPRGTSTTNPNMTRVAYRLDHANQPKYAMCQSLIHPCHLPHIISVCSITCHIIHAASDADVIHATSDADVIRATCHPSSGDTCHYKIGPIVRPKSQIYLTCVIT